MSTVSPKQGATKLSSHYHQLSVFEIMLEDARMNARTDFEEKFVAETLEKYAQYKGEMFWTGQQDTLMRRIAGPDD